MSESLLSESTTETTIESADLGNSRDDFIKALPEGLQESETLGKFGSVEDLARSYIELERLNSSKIKLPQDGDDPEKLKEFYNRVSNVPGLIVKPHADDEDSQKVFLKSLGVPDDAKGYQLPEDMKLDAETQDSLFNFAHKAHMTNDQMKIMAQEKISQLNEQKEAQDKLRETSVALLKEKWGSDYKNRLEGAEIALNYYSEKYGDMVQHLLNMGARDNAAFIAMLSELGSNLSDSGNLVKGQVSYGMTGEEAVIKQSEIRNNPAYYDSSHPDHSALQQQSYKLQKIINGAK